MGLGSMFEGIGRTNTLSNEGNKLSEMVLEMRKQKTNEESQAVDTEFKKAQISTLVSEQARKDKEDKEAQSYLSSVRPVAPMLQNFSPESQQMFKTLAGDRVRQVAGQDVISNKDIMKVGQEFTQNLSLGKQFNEFELNAVDKKIGELQSAISENKVKDLGYKTPEDAQAALGELTKKKDFHLNKIDQMDAAVRKTIVGKAADMERAKMVVEEQRKTAEEKIKLTAELVGKAGGKDPARIREVNALVEKFGLDPNDAVNSVFKNKQISTKSAVDAYIKERERLVGPTVGLSEEEADIKAREFGQEVLDKINALNEQSKHKPAAGKGGKPDISSFD